YIPCALELGATTIVVQEDVPLPPVLPKLLKAYGAKLKKVPCGRRALAELSARAHGYPASSLKLIGITGTKGKTTTAFLTEHLLRSAGYRTALLSTVENRILTQVFKAPLTTPQPDYLHAFFAECRSAGVEYVVMEVAAQALTLERVATLSFHTAVFTNFSLEHSEFYPTQDEYFKAKCLLFENHVAEGRILLNNDDERLAELATRYKGACTYGLRAPSTIQGSVLKSDLAELMLTIDAIPFRAQGLLGDFNASNILAACAAVQPSIPDWSVLQRAVLSFEGVPGRLERYNLPNNAVAFIDNAHTPSSVEAVLAALRPLTDNLIVVFGAGGERDALKRPLMGGIAARYADTIFLTTDNPRSEDPIEIVAAIQQGIEVEERSKIVCELDRKEAIIGAYALSKPGAIIALLGKGPVEYQEIKGIKIPFSEASILRGL
nr:UDP-N-acetylmuramoyl-L-alanyl-D-glutamate--2,6-diaminopimelate ligase [Candidatus Dependentiae bacterium]